MLGPVACPAPPTEKKNIFISFKGAARHDNIFIFTLLQLKDLHNDFGKRNFYAKLIIKTKIPKKKLLTAETHALKLFKIFAHGFVCVLCRICFDRLQMFYSRVKDRYVGG